MEKIRSNRKKVSWRNKKAMIFYICIVAIPFINFILFQVFQYVNTFILAFQVYDPGTASFHFTSDFFFNFRSFFEEFFGQSGFAIGIRNSILFSIGQFMMIPISLLVSYYIWKKMPANRFFQTMLMMPGMISGMVWTVIYKYFMDRAIPELFNLPFGPMSAPATQFIAAVIYCYWLAVAGNMLIYTGTMSGISNELLDAGKVDGLRSIGEFWHIVLPSIYPVLLVFIITAIPGIFSGTANVYEFYGQSADPSAYTIGYIMFVKAVGIAGESQWPSNAVGSLFFTAIAAPLTFLARWALVKFGPKEY